MIWTKIPVEAFVDDAEESVEVPSPCGEDGKVAMVEQDEVPDCPLVAVLAH